MGWLSDIGDAVSSAASTVADVVEDAANEVVDAVEDVVDGVTDAVQDGISAATDWLCKHAGGVGCFFGNVIGGFFSGIIQGIADLLDAYFDIIRDVISIAAAVIRLDLAGIVQGLGDLLIHIVDLSLAFIRFALGGYVVGGIVLKFKRSELIQFVDELVDDTFGDDQEHLDAVRRDIGLEGGRFGFRLPAEHRVFVLDSDTVDLWRMHEDGTIDLYSMAGLLSFDSFSIVAHPNTVVTSVDENGNDNWWPVSRWTISKYLESRGADRRLRVYAMSERAVTGRMETARKKLDEIGVILEWTPVSDAAGFRPGALHEITENEYDFNTASLETYLENSSLERPRGQNCTLVALAGFKLHFRVPNDPSFGRAGARNIAECDEFPDDCATPGRTDQCCNVIDRRESSGVIYRDVYPEYVFKYVLPHEIGHYLGLCHCGHDGVQNVMFRPDVNDILDVGLFSYYWDSESHFSLKDGKNAWRFIVDQMDLCLPQSREGPIIE